MFVPREGNAPTLSPDFTGRSILPAFGGENSCGFRKWQENE